MDAIHKTTAVIYGNEDFAEQDQKVEIEYSGFRSGSKFIADYCKVLTPIELEPSDLYTDLCVAIAKDQHSVTASIDCDIEIAELVRTPVTL